MEKNYGNHRGFAVARGTCTFPVRYADDEYRSGNSGRKQNEDNPGKTYF